MLSTADSAVSVNPLDVPNQPVKFAARHLDVRGRTSKNGPTYRLSFEVEKEIFDTFISAKLDGAIFAVGIVRADYDDLEKEVAQVFLDALKNEARPPVNDDVSAEGVPGPSPANGRPQSKRHLSETTLKAYELCRNVYFQYFLEKEFPQYAKLSPLVGVRYYDEEQAAKFVKAHCGVEHRSEIDKTSASAVAFSSLVERFEKWLKCK